MTADPWIDSWDTWKWCFICMTYIPSKLTRWSWQWVDENFKGVIDTPFQGAVW